MSGKKKSDLPACLHRTILRAKDFLSCGKRPSEDGFAAPGNAWFPFHLSQFFLPLCLNKNISAACC